MKTNQIKICNKKKNCSFRNSILLPRFTSIESIRCKNLLSTCEKGVSMNEWINTLMIPSLKSWHYYPGIDVDEIG